MLAALFGGHDCYSICCDGRQLKSRDVDCGDGHYYTSNANAKMHSRFDEVEATAGEIGDQFTAYSKNWRLLTYGDTSLQQPTQPNPQLSGNMVRGLHEDPPPNTSAEGKAVPII